MQDKVNRNPLVGSEGDFARRAASSLCCLSPVTDDVVGFVENDPCVVIDNAPCKLPEPVQIGCL